MRTVGTVSMSVHFPVCVTVQTEAKSHLRQTSCLSPPYVNWNREAAVVSQTDARHRQKNREAGRDRAGNCNQMQREE